MSSFPVLRIIMNLTITNLLHQQNSKLKKIKSLIYNKDMIIVLGLAFASGIPLGLTGATLQAWFAVENVSVATIGLLALIGQPYVYKFVWAPLMDAVVLPFGGRRRGWLFVTQWGIAGTLALMALLSPSQSPGKLALIALVLAFLSASQDIVVDAYRTEILKPEARGTGSAMHVTGYRIAMLVSGGIALIMADSIGFKTTYLIMAGIMILASIVTLFAKEPEMYQTKIPKFHEAVIEPFKEFLTRKYAWWLLFLIVYYKLGDAFAGALTSAFLIDLGFSLKTIGFSFKTTGLIATLVGAFVGGIILTKMRLYVALFWFGVLQAASNLMYLWLALSGTNHFVMLSTIFVENLCGSMGTAAFLALLMSLCDKRYTATQFALFTAASAVGRVYVTPLAGYIVEATGWAQFYVWTFIISLPGLVLLAFLKKPIINASEIKEQPELATT